VSTLTLLTDFGLEDAWVGMMKGVILGINPEAGIVDITHQIPPQDTAAAAWMIAAVYPYFPKGSVHIIVVDPGVGGRRNVICAALEGHIFLAPDNGVLSSVLKPGVNADDIRIVKNQDLFLDRISNTFHGRDIFAPVGAYLSMSKNIEATGPAVKVEDLVQLDLPKAVLTKNGDLMGTVILIDRFGNIITNIDRKAFEAFRAASRDCRPEITLGNYSINGLSDSYSQAEKDRPLAIFGSMGYLEIAVYCKNAGGEMNISRGDRVKVSRSRQHGCVAD